MPAPGFAPVEIRKFGISFVPVGWGNQMLTKSYSRRCSSAQRRIASGLRFGAVSEPMAPDPWVV